MRKSTKAALLSACVFPGAGHLWLKNYWVGLPLVTVSGSIFIVLVIYVVKQASLIAQEIVDGKIAPDFVVIHDALTKSLYGAAGQLLELLSIALIVIWLFSIFHSYYLGRLAK